MNVSSSYWYPICFLTSGILLISGTLLNTNLSILAAVIMFLIWDIAFISTAGNFTGRNANFTIQQVVQARSYISYFIPFYGLLVGLLFTAETEKRVFFLELCSKAEIPVLLLFTPFCLASIVILLFPLRVSEDVEGVRLTPAIQTLMISNFFIEKCVVFIFSHCIIRLLVAWIVS